MKIFKFITIAYWKSYFLIHYLYFKVLYNKRIRIGKKCYIHKGTKIVLDNDSRLEIGNHFFSRDYFYINVVENGRISIGNNVFFNNFCSINSMKAISIGNDCIFGENVRIYDHNHIYSNPELLIKDQGFLSENIEIGDNCWIGSNVVILKGVTIGRGSIIGANTVVFKNVGKDTILLSNGMEKKRYK